MNPIVSCTHTHTFLHCSHQSHTITHNHTPSHIITHHHTSSHTITHHHTSSHTVSWSWSSRWMTPMLSMTSVIRKTINTHNHAHTHTVHFYCITILSSQMTRLPVCISLDASSSSQNLASLSSPHGICMKYSYLPITLSQQKSPVCYDGVP